jgi:Alpha/beta hydrolase family
VSDTLVISGGGVITVASEDLLVTADRLALFADEVDAVAAELVRIVRDRALSGFGLRAVDLADQLRATSALLRLALDAYSLAEAQSAQWAEVTAQQVAHRAGAVVPIALAPLALALLSSPVVAGAALWLAAGAPQASSLLAGHRAALSDARVVRLLRLVAGSVDDAARGASGLPSAASLLADDRLTGLLGRETVARLLLVALPGPVPAGPVRLSATSTRSVRPPDSLAELASRIPEPQSDGPQLRVERYEGPSGPVYALYLGGTVELDAEAGAEPWDLASNLGAMGGASAHSLAAAEAALRASGATSCDPVVLVGYSQGGLLASRLANSAEFSVRGMVTVGSPGGAIPPPEGIPVLAVEHAEDLVPALAGPVAAGTRVVVTRSLYDGKPPESPRPVPAHELAEYRATLALTDRSDERRVAQARASILGLFAGSAGTAATWRAERMG